MNTLSDWSNDDLYELFNRYNVLLKTPRNNEVSLEMDEINNLIDGILLNPNRLQTPFDMSRINQI